MGEGGGYRHSYLTIYLSYLSIWTFCSTNVHSNPLLPTTLNTPVGWHASCVINSCVVMPEFNIVVAVALLSMCNFKEYFFVFSRSSVLMHEDPITLHIALDKEQKAEGTLYIDDGQSYEYKEVNRKRK